MAIPVLHLNLVPPPTVWRQNHEALGLAALLGGIVALGLAGGFSVHKYVQASREGRLMVSISAEAQKVAREQARVVESLSQVDTTERLPRYRVAERIFLERSLPWSRLTTEMERNLVQDVRIRSLQRVRASDGSVTMKVRGEAKNRAAEAKFIEALQGNAMFAQVVLEREAERTGGGIDFDLSLPVSAAPPPFEAVPIPPVQVIDQFGRPLAKGAKILGTLPAGKAAVPAVKAPVGTRPLPGLPPPAPARPPAQPPPGMPGIGAPTAPGMPAALELSPGMPPPQRTPNFSRGPEPAPAPTIEMSRPAPRARPIRKGDPEGGAA